MGVPIAFSAERLIRTELPPLSGIVLRIREMLCNEYVSQRAIADEVSHDPVLAARILRLANSAYYAGERTVASLTTAITSIGNQAISDTVLVSGLSDAFGRGILRSDMGRQIWLHLLTTAMAV